MRSPHLRALATSVLCAAVLCAAAWRALPAQAAPRPAPGTPAGTSTLAARLGYPPNAKLLLLHADDLGLAHAVDSASFDALDRGVISSASIMMPTPWVAEVAAYARAHPDADLGLHLTLTSEWLTYRWGPVAAARDVPTLLDSAGTFWRDTPDVAARAAPDQVERELRAQVERARALGIRPTHLDSHMGALFTTPALYAVFARVARSYNLPFLAARGPDGRLPADVRPDRDVVLDTVITVGPEVPPDRWPAFYLDAVRGLKPGLTEMIVHLGRDDAELRAVTVGHAPWGSAWRQRDADVLRSPAFRQALKDHGVVLVRWKDLQRAGGSRP